MTDPCGIPARTRQEGERCCWKRHEAFLPRRYATSHLTKLCRSRERWIISIKGLLDYAIKIAATWVACKKLHARIARPFTLRIQHRAIFKTSVSVIVFQFMIVYLKSNPAYPIIFTKAACINFSFPNEGILNSSYFCENILNIYIQ